MVYWGKAPAPTGLQEWRSAMQKVNKEDLVSALDGLTAQQLLLVLQFIRGLRS